MTVCDIIAEVDGTSSADCPQETGPGSQSGELADADVPVTLCGAIVAVDGSAIGSGQPARDAALTDDLPTSDDTQSAPIDGVLPVSACSIVVAVAGNASSSCEPVHVASSQNGSVPVDGTVTLCSIAAAVGGSGSGTCTGAQTADVTPVGQPGSQTTGATVPVEPPARPTRCRW